MQTLQTIYYDSIEKLNNITTVVLKSWTIPTIIFLPLN